MNAQQLTGAELEAVLSCIPDQSSQAKRLIEHLAHNPDSISATVASTCAIGNISDVARKINPTLFKHQLFISCKRPIRPVVNRSGELSNMFQWGIYKLPNEPENSLDRPQKIAEIK